MRAKARDGVQRGMLGWMISSVPLLLAHTRVAAEEVIVHDKHAGGLPQASLLQHDLPHGEACGVRRAACGVRRAACGGGVGCMSRASCGVRLRAAKVWVRGARCEARDPDLRLHGMALRSGAEVGGVALTAVAGGRAVRRKGDLRGALGHRDAEAGLHKYKCGQRGMAVRGQRGWATAGDRGGGASAEARAPGARRRRGAPWR